MCYTNTRVKNYLDSVEGVSIAGYNVESTLAQIYLYGGLEL